MPTNTSRNAPTPGPWHWWNAKEGRPKGYDLCKLIGSNGENVLTNYGGEGKDAMGTTPERRANAALICAAPDLLAALKVLTNHAKEAYPHFEDTRGQADIKAAEAAIAKAQPKVSA